MIITKIFASLKPIFSFLFQPIMVMLWIAFLTYGVFIPLLSYFWDDLFIHWVADVYGTAGLERYFYTNRPVWGMIYQITTPLLGDSPWVWQIFGILWRWIAATGLYFLLRELWRNHKEPALWAGLLFVVYPGFSQQYMGMMYGHFFIVMSAFFYSFVFNLRALRVRHRKYAYHGIALLLSAVNLFTMEYFFALELLRPFLIAFTLHRVDKKPPQPLKSILLEWLPYLGVFLLAGFWRVFFYDYQTEHYQLNTLGSIASQPLNTISGLIVRVFQDYWTAMVLAWGNAFQLPNFETIGSRALALIAIFTLLTFIFLMIYVVIVRRELEEPKSENQRMWFLTIGLSLLAYLLAGIAFWATNLPVKLGFAFDRFTIPFMVAFSMFWTAVMFLFPIPKYLRSVIFVVLISLSTSHQLHTGIKFQRDWDQQARMFWQLTWRAPSIEEGTLVFTHELPITYFSDNSLTAALNWSYDPDGAKDPENIPYILYYPSIRLGVNLIDLQPNQQISHDILVGTFHGNTSRSLAFYYNPPACLRVLDPEIERNNWMVPLEVRETVPLSDLSRIRPEPQMMPPENLYGQEPEHNWCYYFEKADLARQFGNWDEVVRLGDIAFNLGDYPNDPAERMPFIEGYAHTGRWQNAVDQTMTAAEISSLTYPMLCGLWARIDRQTLPGAEHDQAVAVVFDTLDCSLQP